MNDQEKTQNTRELYCSNCKSFTQQMACSYNMMCCVCGYKNGYNSTTQILQEIKELEALRDKLLEEKKNRS